MNEEETWLLFKRFELKENKILLASLLKVQVACFVVVVSQEIIFLQ